MLREVDVEQAERLRAVDERHHAVLARQRAQLLGGEEIADRARQVREGQDLRLRRDRLLVGVDVVLHPGVRIDLRDLDHGEAEPLRLFLPRRQVARVVVVKDDDLVAGLQIEAARDHVVGLAGVAGDDDLFRRDAQERGERLAKVFLSRRSAARDSAPTDRCRRCRSRASALRAPAARRGRGWRRSARRDRRASRTARAPISRRLHRCRRSSARTPAPARSASPRPDRRRAPRNHQRQTDGRNRDGKLRRP